MFKSTPAVKQLFYINAIMFILTLFSTELFTSLAMYNIASDKFLPYQLITYQFLHSGFLHIIFNMIVLVSFGPDVEKRYGYLNFILFYLICGVMGGLLHTFMSPNPVVGASASIWGIMVMFTLLYPNQKMYLFFIPYGIRGKYIISALFTYELLVAIFAKNDGVSHYGHIGGALMGLVLYLSNRMFIKKSTYGKRL